MVIAIIIIVLLGIGALFVANIKNANELSVKISKAIAEFDNICNVNRQFTETELLEFKARYKELFLLSKKASNSILLGSRIKTKLGITKFVKIYSSVDDIRNSNNKSFSEIQYVNQCLKSVNQQYSNLINKSDYFTYSEMIKFKEDNNDFFDNLKKLRNKDLLKKVDDVVGTIRLLSYYENLEYNRYTHNQCFIGKELKDNKDFFDSEEVGSLSEQQRDSAVRLEDNCLVISSAGSGKTKTMVGKLQYLVKKRNIDPDRILVLTYTKAAAKELSERLASTLLVGRTFHSVAMEIISEVSGKKPSIAPNDLFLNVFNNMLKDNEFLKNVLIYLENYQSQVKPSEKYKTAADYYFDRKKYGIQALYTDMDGNAVFTKSEEEKRICNYLTHWGIDFRYEEPYELQTTSPTYHQYRPDFSIYYEDYSGVKRRLYLEHFAIGEDGNVPQWFGDGVQGGWYKANNDYKKGIEWKKQLHRNSGTTLIYTTSADFGQGKVEYKLKKLLEDAGVPIKHVPENELYNKIVIRNKSMEKSILEMCQGFVSLLKSNRKTINAVYSLARNKGSMRDCFIIQSILKPLYTNYETALVNAGVIDFTDAIIQATDYCNKGLWKDYDYILVDEFQDISIDRYQFLQSLRRKSPLTKLFCVGDDWQSIYRFSGSDVNLFTKFSDYFGYTEECKLETSYRFGNPLIETSSAFIQKNPEQKKKTVKPLVDLDKNTYIEAVSYDDEKSLYQLLAKYISNVPEDKSIYILGRYTYDVNVLGEDNVSADENRINITVGFGKRKVPFLTIHSSKGLEADYVFLLNCNSGLYGFPSLISDDPVMDYVLSEDDHYPFGEERRVFYVAITRAKEHTFLLYDAKKPSEFVTEMFDKHFEIPEKELCPICKNGKLVVLKRGVTKTGNTYINWGCNNYSVRCSYFKREFINSDKKTKV